jgi:hypothetical protein
MKNKVYILGLIVLLGWAFWLLALMFINGDSDYTPGPVTWEGWALTLMPLIGTPLLLIGDYIRRQK